MRDSNGLQGSWGKQRRQMIGYLRKQEQRVAGCNTAEETVLMQSMMTKALHDTARQHQGVKRSLNQTVD